MSKVSVIVPVYGVEKYIERCARSLFEQTMIDIEYIFVNDCTPDNSMTILNDVLAEYPHRKDQVIIYSMPQNSGQAAVRKQGISLATGDYIIHCDSDDWVDVKMYEKLYNFAVSDAYDMVWCDYFRSNGVMHARIPQTCSPKKREILEAFLVGRLVGSLCNRLCKRNLYQRMDFVYPLADMTEDLVISTQIVLFSPKIGYLPEPLYYYYWNPNSICMKPDEQHVLKNYYGMLTNTELIFAILAKYVNVCEFSREIDCKKCLCKGGVIPLLHKRKYRDLWRNTYPEINRRILRNPVISRNTKIRAFCLLYGMSPLYILLKKLSDHRQWRKVGIM